MKLHYRVLGEGAPLVILHGLFGMSDNWQSFARRWVENGFQVILPDLRNHGHSPHSPVHTYEAMAGDVEELARDLQLDNPIWIGHSMGGKVAMKLAALRNERKERFVVVDIAPWEYAPQHESIFEHLMSLPVQTIQSRSEAEAHFTGRLSDFNLRMFLLKNLYRTTAGDFQWRINLPVLYSDRDEITRDTWPAEPILHDFLFVGGTESRYIDPNRFNEIKKHFLHAELFMIEGAGHWIHAEKPEELYQCISSWLEKIKHTL